SAGVGGITLALTTLTIGGNTLTVKAGDNVTSGTIGLTLGTVSLGGPSMRPGNPVFDVQGTAAASLNLTLGAFTDQAIAPRTITFQNSGAAQSSVTLGVAAASLVDGTVVNVNSGANAGVTLNLNIAGALGTFAQVNVNGSSSVALGASQTVAALNGNGSVSATANSTLTIGNVLSPAVSDSVFNGVLASGASLAVVKTGLGSLTLGGSASNTYSGSTVISGGTLVLAKTGGAIAVPTNLTIGVLATSAVNGTATLRLAGNEQVASSSSLTLYSGSTFNLNGNSQTLGNLIGTPSGTILNNATGTSSTLTIGSGNATGGQFLGNIADNSTGTGTMTLIKTGTGTSALGGYNSYSGTTLVQAGSLQVGIGGVGTTGTGAVTVKNNGTILGTGVVQGSSFTAESGSTIHAGDDTAQTSYATLTFDPVSGSGAFDFQSDSTVVLGINPGGLSDLLNFIGTGTNSLLFNGNLTVTAAAYTPVAPEIFNLLDWSGLVATPTFASRYMYTGVLSGNGDEAAGLDLPNISGSGYGWDISNLTFNGTIAVVSVVPEPSRVLLLALGMGLLLARRRR
ncbi:MAG: hypothetical protein JWO08_3502, partial [Verrucomicrobiaceae bacterium]|nr:hypothetical protein [Verrucomicrobiaceae bacterium]